MKKIGIDVSQIVYGTGASVYTHNLILNLLKLDKKNKYVFHAGTLRRRKDFEILFSKIKGGFEIKYTLLSPSLADFLWNQAHIIPIEAFTGNIDVFHSSDWTEPPSKAKKVTTVHDVTPIIHPEWTNPKIVDVHTRRLKWVKKESECIIVPSNATKSDLVLQGFNENLIQVIHEAPEDIFKPVDQVMIDSTLAKYHIKDRYLLAVGANERKNIKNIAKAFRKLNLPQTKLVVIGQKSVHIDPGPDIAFLGHVDANDRPALYAGALGILYASHYEGFGLPILEGFAVGTPVLTSNISSMPEVAGKAAVLVDPANIDSISQGIHTLLQSRESWKAKGFARIKEFSWLRNAEQTLKIYETL